MTTRRPPRPYTGRTAPKINQHVARFADRRTRRVRTRSAAKARALREQGR